VFAQLVREKREIQLGEMANEIPTEDVGTNLESRKREEETSSRLWSPVLS
jgi:hypothetical protein